MGGGGNLSSMINNTFEDFDEFTDNIGEVELSDFEEKEFDLETIGIKGTSLVIEQDVSYIYSDEDLYIEIPNRIDIDLISTVSEDNVIIQGEEFDNKLIITIEQYKLIKEILEKF